MSFFVGFWLPGKVKALVVDNSPDFWRSTDLSSDGTKNLVEKNLVFTQKGGGCNKLAADEFLDKEKLFFCFCSCCCCFFFFWLWFVDVYLKHLRAVVPNMFSKDVGIIQLVFNWTNASWKQSHWSSKCVLVEELQACLTASPASPPTCCSRWQVGKTTTPWKLTGLAGKSIFFNRECISSCMVDFPLPYYIVFQERYILFNWSLVETPSCRREEPWVVCGCLLSSKMSIHKIRSDGVEKTSDEGSRDTHKWNIMEWRDAQDTSQKICVVCLEGRIVAIRKKHACWLHFLNL